MNFNSLISPQNLTLTNFWGPFRKRTLKETDFNFSFFWGTFWGGGMGEFFFWGYQSHTKNTFSIVIIII
jgi:hypothetical protein